MRQMRRSNDDEIDSYEFGGGESEYDDDVSDEEIDGNMDKLVERDTLGDSGYGEGNLSAMSDHTYFKTPKRAKQAKHLQRSRGQKKGVSMEVQALLSLANAATKQLEEIKATKDELN